MGCVLKVCSEGGGGGSRAHARESESERERVREGWRAGWAGLAGWLGWLAGDGVAPDWGWEQDHRMLPCF